MGMAWRRTVAGLMILAGLLTLGYVGISSYIAEQLVYEAPKAIVKTPASQSLRFANVSFPSRNDGIGLKGWLIPGVLPDGRLTVDRAIVSDSAYAEVVPLLEREVAKRTIAPVGRVPGVFAPAALVMARLLYGVDFFAARPVSTIARIAPRPLLLIHGTADDYVPIANFRQLNAAATSAPGANVTTWIVPNASHAQAFKKTGVEYVTRVVAFFDAALGAAG